MKSDHRHELKTNELADWLAHFPEWANQNRTNIIAVAVVLVAAVVVYFWIFYRRDVALVRNQVRLTNLVTQIPPQMSNVARAAMQNTDQSYALLPITQDLQDFAQSVSQKDMAALALIERAEVLRAELHYRLADVGREDLSKQTGQAQASYQQALERTPSPALAATAHFGLGLCEEDLGDFDKAAETYREVAGKPEYAGTAAQAAAAYRLQVMDGYKSVVVFKPAPPPQASQPQVTQPQVIGPQVMGPQNQPQQPVVTIKPTDANAPVVVTAPNDVTIEPAAPAPATDTNEAPAPATDTNEAPAPVEAAPVPEANAPADG